MATTNTRGPIRASASKTTGNTARRKFRWKTAEPDWHPEVQGLYNSLKKSEHFEDFQESDMYYARIVAIEHSDILYNSVEKNAALIKIIFEQWKELGATLGTRRRLALEVEKVEEQKNTGELMNQMAHSILTGKAGNA